MCEPLIKPQNHLVSIYFPPLYHPLGNPAITGELPVTHLNLTEARQSQGSQGDEGK